MYSIKFVSEVEDLDNQQEQRVCLNHFSGVKLS